MTDVFFIGNNCQFIMYLLPQEVENLDIGQPTGLPVSEKSKNRLYLSWRNSKGNDCKMIGPETKCFCNHKFKDHEYLNSKGKQVPCKAPKCKCKCFDYIPSHGAYDFKCLCKHSFKDHDCITRKCTKQKCQQCSGFASAWTCSCASKFSEHQTIIQTYQQRKSKGKTLNDMGRLHEELDHINEQGSLYRPIKMDPEERAKKRWSSTSNNNPFLSQGINCGYLKEEEQIESFSIAMKDHRR